jgi:hypothetical protein
MRHNASTQQRQDKRRFIERIGLHWSPGNKAMSISHIPTFYLQKFPKNKEYPPHRKWLYESGTIYAKWRWYIEEGPLPDKREVVRDMFHVNSKQLQLDIGPGESAVVYDDTSHNLVAFVMRNFTMEHELLAHVEDIIKQNLEVRKNMRVSRYYLLWILDTYKYY